LIGSEDIADLTGALPDVEDTGKGWGFGLSSMNALGMAEEPE
jgi:hypothetical protein